ncbi:MAG: 50S ribosomal protein L22 [Patescibacteria group bacterium]
MKAYLKNYRQSPRKVRLVSDLIKGKPVDRALLILDTTPKRATLQLSKLVRSAIANAKSQGVEAKDLFVQEIRVDKGLTMHRYMPKAHGRASRFDKHSSNIILVLANKSEMGAKRKNIEKSFGKTSAAMKPEAGIKVEKTENKEQKTEKKTTKKVAKKSTKAKA